MKFSPEVEKLLIPAKGYGKYLADDYDIEFSDIVKDRNEIETADVGLVGICSDTGAFHRRGSSLGPQGIRDALIVASTYEPGIDADLSKGFVFTDFGNIDHLYTDLEGTYDRIATVMKEIFESGVTPLVLGGDHGNTYGVTKGLSEAMGGKPMGCIMIDGHLDVKVTQHGERNSSGTAFRRLIDEGRMKTENFVEIGINGWHTSPHYMQWMKEQDILMIPSREVHRIGVDETVQRALDRATAGVDGFFFSFDIDGIDAAYAPGTSCPNPGALTSAQALELVWQIAQHPKCMGMDLCEVAPAMDPGQITTLLGSALAMQFNAAIAKRNGKY